MSYISDISKAIRYIEDNLTQELTIEDVGKKVNISPYYFQKSFSLLCGYSISEYIRNRRLTLAGKDLQIKDMKVIDVAMKYGYESPDSFTKAFTRFHGVTPNAIKQGQGELRCFSPLRFELILKGGFEMDCKIVKKEELKLIGYSTFIEFDKGYEECPKFWDEHYKFKRDEFIVGQYGVCFDQGGKGKFKYCILDEYDKTKVYPKEAEVIIIPSHTFAVFASYGPLPNALQEVNTKVFKEWLPNNDEYEIIGNYNIEYYDDASKYKQGIHDKDYYSEIWLPIESK